MMGWIKMVGRDEDRRGRRWEKLGEEWVLSLQWVVAVEEGARRRCSIERGSGRGRHAAPLVRAQQSVPRHGIFDVTIA